MEQLRVLIIDMPAMLREIVRETVVGATDMNVVAEVDGRSPIAAAVRDHGADVVVVNADHPELSSGSALARATAKLRLLAVSANGRESFLYTLRPVKTALGELSPEHLLDAIRGAPERAATDSND